MKEEAIEQSFVHCMYCNAVQPVAYCFCSSCGKESSVIAQAENQKQSHFNFQLKSLAAYSLIILVMVLAAGLTNDSLTSDIIWTSSFAIVCLGFAFYNPGCWRLLSLQSIQLGPLLLTIGACLFSAVFVSTTVDALNEIVFGTSEGNEFEIYFLHDSPLAIALLLSAVAPAIFEELAFRGFVFENIKALGGEMAAIVGSSFLFALVHLSLLSVFWIFPFGLFLAYLRYRYNTILLGMVGHFVHNASVILIDFYGVW